MKYLLTDFLNKVSTSLGPQKVQEVVYRIMGMCWGYCLSPKHASHFKDNIRISKSMRKEK